MRKQRKNAGFTLIELLCALLVMVFLIMGIGVGMDAGSEIYDEATFEAESATLAGIINTAIGDILRFSFNVEKLDQEQLDAGGISSMNFIFTSSDYGIQAGYFHIAADVNGKQMGVLQMRSLSNANTVELVNMGAYPDLAITDFYITYYPRLGNGVARGYCEASYNIVSISDSEHQRSVKTVVRLMNDD